MWTSNIRSRMFFTKAAEQFSVHRLKIVSVPRESDQVKFSYLSPIPSFWKQYYIWSPVNVSCTYEKYVIITWNGKHCSNCEQCENKISLRTPIRTQYRMFLLVNRANVAHSALISLRKRRSVSRKIALSTSENIRWKPGVRKKISSSYFGCGFVKKYLRNSCTMPRSSASIRSRQCNVKSQRALESCVELRFIQLPFLLRIRLFSLTVSTTHVDNSWWKYKNFKVYSPS